MARWNAGRLGVGERALAGRRAGGRISGYDAAVLMNSIERGGIGGRLNGPKNGWTGDLDPLARISFVTTIVS